MKRAITLAAMTALVLTAGPRMLGAATASLDLKAAGRTAEEQERDKYNKPEELYAFWGIKAGDTVIDFIPGEGYNTYLLSQLVGPKGKVISLGAYGFDKLEERLKTSPLPNVEHMKTGLTTLPADSVDAVITIRNYHDLPAEQRPQVLENIKRVLKPGGVFGVADARATKGRDVENHRIADDVVKSEITAAGFKLAAASEMLANKDDDHTKPTWEKRYALDQSCFKFVKEK